MKGTEADAARYPADQSPSGESGTRLLAALRRVAATDVPLALAAGSLSTLLAGAVLKIWRAQLDVPFAYIWDANQYAMYIKEILDHGWYFRNPNLGAPFGQQLYDYPNVSTDNLQAFAIKLLGLLSSDWATVMNVYFLLTFPLVAIAAFVAFRHLGSAAAPSVVCAVLFSLLPYHFARGEHHLFYSAYVAVPIGAWLALSVFAAKNLFARRVGVSRGPLAFASRRTLMTVALCVFVATASGAAYYAFFTVLLVAVGMLAALLGGLGRRPLVEGALVILLIGSVLAANLAPTIVYRATHGSNPVAGQRSWTESEYQALKLTQLVLPIEHHRVAALAHLSGKYADFQRSVGAPAQQPQLQRPGEWEAVHLGVVGTIGFALLLIVAFAAVIGRRWGDSLPAVYRHAAAATLAAFLIGTVGGLSVLIAAGITPQFRSWNRISIFIAFFALLAVALVLSALGRRWRGTRSGRLAFGAVLVVVLGLGVLDQTSRAYTPPYDSTAVSFRSDAAFVHAIERRLGGEGSVYQLPYVPFPDGGLTHRLTEYDLVRGYFHSDRLRWSFGAMSGRPEDWQAELSRQPLAVQVRGVGAAGFDGIYVDRRGYADSGRALQHELTALTGGSPLESRDGQLVFFDLRPLSRRLAGRYSPSVVRDLRSAVLRPIRLEWPAGAALAWDDKHVWHETGAEAGLVLVNPSERPLRASFEALLTTRGAGRAPAAVRYPDGSSSRVVATNSGTRIRRELQLPPGRSVVSFTGRAPLWAEASVLDERLRPFGPDPAHGS